MDAVVRNRGLLGWQIVALKSIAAEWLGFSEMVFTGKEYSATQRIEMRKAFFAGAWAMFCMVEEIGTPAVTEQQGVNHLEEIRIECKWFKTELMRQYGETN